MRSRARTGIFPVLFFALATLLGARAAGAQFVVRSWLDWRTLETRHFAFHYPPELEAWTRAVAAHAESIDAAVSDVVGFQPDQKTHIVVDDPYQTPNGMAWPFLDRPVINLWASPPTPRDDVGEFSSWGDMLLSHEFGHIAHLTRPSRNGRMRRLWRLLPVDLGPLALRAPRWAIEGYATYVEGRVTGSGRPHGAWRPAFLRQWALEGQLPRYEQLNAWGAYAGGEFAYLAGSAFLEWLVERRGDSSLVQVWRRLSARQNRSFDEAFAGVFGESPSTLYGRFTTDVTARSVEAARLIRAAGAGDTGIIEQRLSRSTGDPAISADGRRIALVIRSATRPSRVVIWNTAAEPDTGKARRDSLLRVSDPEDVPARSIYPPPKKEIAVLRSGGGAPYESPRFLRDGRVLLWRSTPRGNGSLTSDLYLWNPEHHSVRRVTHDASVRDPDPSPDGHSAFATRCARGWCDLVRVNLDNGAVTILAEGSPTRSFYRPRVDPDGARVAVSMHDGARWRIAIVDSRTNVITLRDPDDGVNRYDPAWLANGDIVCVSDRGGVANLERSTEDGRVVALTSVTGAAVAPEPTASGGIWFLSLYSRGYDLRRLDSASASPAAAADLARALAPAAQVPADRHTFTENAISESRPFGVGPRLFRWIPNGVFDADGAGVGVALVSRDVIGRSELLANFAAGDASTWRGGSVGAIWRGTHPTIRLQAFAAQQDLGASRADVPTPRDLSVALNGGVVSIDDARQLDTWGAQYRLGVAVGSGRVLRTLTGDRPPFTSRTQLFGEAGLSATQRNDRMSVSESLAGQVAIGRAFDARFRRALSGGRVSTSGVLPIAVDAWYGAASRDAPHFEQFTLGGGPSSVLDGSLLSQRIVAPALPAGISVGSSVLAYRAAIGTAVSVYLWSGSTSSSSRFERWQRVIGAEWSMSVGPIASAGTPAARAQFGIGESLDAPFRRKLRAYASLVLNP